MGDVLRDKFRLATLTQIKNAYKAALGDSGTICKSLENRDLWALHAVRNVLVHNGGKVDGKFKGDMKSHPEFNAFNVGQQLKLTAKQVLMLTDAGWDASYTVLFRDAYDWLNENPD